jgi:type IV pilus assembly protein PilB
MAERKKIGDLLVEAGLIDKFQLASALAHQRNWGGKLGAILIEMRFVDESELARILSEKLRIPYEDLFQETIAEEVLALIKPEIAKKHGVVPARKDGRSLVLAMSDPLDIDAMDEVRFITGMSIKPVLAMESEIQDAIRKYYCKEEVSRQVKATILERQNASPDGTGTPQAVMDAVQAGQPQPCAWERPERLRDEVPDRVLLDALISLMLEKLMISEEELREELQRMIELGKDRGFERSRG